MFETQTAALQANLAALEASANAQRRMEHAWTEAARLAQAADALPLWHLNVFTPTGVITVPLLVPGKPLTEEAFRLLPDGKQAEVQAKMREITGRTEEALLAV